MSLQFRPTLFQCKHCVPSTLENVHSVAWVATTNFGATVLGLFVHTNEKGGVWPGLKRLLLRRAGLDERPKRGASVPVGMPGGEGMKACEQQREAESDPPSPAAVFPLWKEHTRYHFLIKAPQQIQKKIRNDK